MVLRIGVQMVCRVSQLQSGGEPDWVDELSGVMDSDQGGTEAVMETKRQASPQSRVFWGCC